MSETPDPRVEVVARAAHKVTCGLPADCHLAYGIQDLQIADQVLAALDAMPKVAPETLGLGGIALIAEERRRQVEVEDHDTGHDKDLILAAYCYMREVADRRLGRPAGRPGDGPFLWPWASRYWKPTADEVRNLVKAGALIAAAIDSIRGVRDA